MTSKRSRTDRRSYLKLAGTAAVAAIAGCQGTDRSEGANHEAPHPNDEEVPDSELTAESLGGEARPEEPAQPKHAVSFDHTPMDGAYCGSCQNFVPDQNDDDFGACTDVRGKIHPCDSCARYQEYDGEGVPCGQV